MAGGRFGVTWKLVQACVRPPVRLVGSGQCHIAEDSDDEEMDTNLKKYDAKADDSVAYKEETTGPTFDDSDEEVEEVEDNEEVEEEKPPSPKKKKKVVRRRKVVKSAE